MEHLHAASETARADADKRDPVAMARIQVGLDFKYEPGKSRRSGLDLAIRRLPTARRRRELQESVQKRLEAEIGQSTAKKDRRHFAAQETVKGPRGSRRVEQCQLFAKLRVRVPTDLALERPFFKAGGRHRDLAFTRVTAIEVQNPPRPAVIDALKRLSETDWPGHRT